MRYAFVGQPSADTARGEPSQVSEIRPLGRQYLPFQPKSQARQNAQVARWVSGEPKSEGQHGPTQRVLRFPLRPLRLCVTHLLRAPCARPQTAPTCTTNPPP